MLYSDKVISHFKKPHNQGAIKDADAVGQVGNPTCGDIMRIYIKTKKPHFAKTTRGKQDKKINKQDLIISDIKFETMGCAAAIAVSSMLTDLAKGKTLAEAKKIEKDDIVKELGGLPPLKVHCSMLGVEALREAIGKLEGRS